MVDRRVREEIDEDSLCVCVNSGVQREGSYNPAAR